MLLVTDANFLVSMDMIAVMNFSFLLIKLFFSFPKRKEKFGRIEIGESST